MNIKETIKRMFMSDSVVAKRPLHHAGLLAVPALSVFLFYLLVSLLSPSGFQSFNYPLHLLVMIHIYIILGFSVNIIVGYTGLLSIGHGALYGIAAYMAVLGLVGLNLTFIPALFFAVITSMLLSLLVSLPSLRLKKEYFVLATLGFQMIVYTVLYNWTSVTKGPYGISGIPNPEIFGLFEISRPWQFALFSFVFVVILYWYFYRIDTSPFGKIIKAVRDDELVVTSMGRNVALIKVFVFAVSAGIAAFAGALYSSYVTYIDPTSFTIDESIFILTIIFIGGSGNLAGVIVGAVFVELLPEVLRCLQMSDAVAANMRQIIFGLILIAMMRFRPTGIAGDYDYD